MSDTVEVTSSPVVATVYNHLLEAINHGSLQPGDRVSDATLAKDFGISRTPVREALQRLRDIGVIEASANRFTRVAVVTPRQTFHAMQVWIALYRVLVNEVAPTLSDNTIAEMTEAHEAYLRGIEAQDFTAMASANFDFYGALLPLTGNDVLVRAVISVVYMVRLGSLHLPQALDVKQLEGCQAALLKAARDRDPDAAVAAIEGLRDLTIPQE